LAAESLDKHLRQTGLNRTGPDRKLIIAVIGGGECSAEDALVAEAVGKELARRGATVICGGLGGVMEAACLGAASQYGLTIGILPGDDPDAANPYVDIAIASGVGTARNIAVVKSAQAVIAFGGEYGTLTEIAFALKSGIPVIGLNTWSMYRNNQKNTSIIEATDAVDAVEKALSLAKKSGKGSQL
jgi:uncharacterized protein (TIGR00725 family)